MRIASLIGAVAALAIVLWMAAVGTSGSIYLRDNAVDHAACVGSSLSKVLPGRRGHAADRNEAASCPEYQGASAAPVGVQVPADAAG